MTIFLRLLSLIVALSGCQKDDDEESSVPVNRTVQVQASIYRAEAVVTAATAIDKVLDAFSLSVVCSSETKTVTTASFQIADGSVCRARLDSLTYKGAVAAPSSGDDADFGAEEFESAVGTFTVTPVDALPSPITSDATISFQIDAP